MTAIVLDLPPPMSVNETRKLDRAALRKIAKWRDRADGLVLVQKCRRPDPVRLRRLDQVEITITLNEELVHMDLDNPAKQAVDYLKRLDVVADDNKKHVRQITLRWGGPLTAPEGCRIEVREVVQ